MTEFAADLRAVDAAMLTPLVRRALGTERLDLADWHHEAFGHSLDEVYGTARSIVRFNGAARVGEHAVPWSLVLKIVTAVGTPDDPASPGNGAREPLAYQTGFLAGICGVQAPQCFAVLERPGGSHWLWLEDVREDVGREWPLERYLLAARHLARFNGAFLAGRTTVSYPWLSRSPLRDVVLEMAPRVMQVADAREDPLVARAISTEAASALLALLQKAGHWLDILDRMPQVICHWDAHRANLLSRTTGDGEVQTVAVDWAGVGWGPVGAELSKLLSQTVNFFGLSVDALPALDARLFDHYLQGLRDTGWRGDPRLVRFGYTAASAMRLVVRTATALELASSTRARAAFERAAGLEFSSLADKFRGTLPYYLSLVDEADRIADLV